MAKTPVSYSSRNFLNSFRKRYSDIKISNNEYFNVLNMACLEIRDCLLEDGQFKLANRLGDLMIRKFYPKGKGSSFTIFDKGETNKAGKPVFQFNDHSGGFMYRFIWNKKRCKMINDKNMWTFKPIRSIKRKLATILKTKSNDYPQGIFQERYENDPSVAPGSTF